MQQFISAFARVLPCDACARHLRSYIREHPPTLNSRGDLVRWVFDLHNVANGHARRSSYDFGTFLEEWRERVEHGRVRPVGKALTMACLPLIAAMVTTGLAARTTSPHMKAMFATLILAILAIQTFVYMDNAFL